MLLTDGNPNATEDLRIYESAVLSVANTEFIDLNEKLNLASQEIRVDVMDFLLNHAAGTDPKSGARRSVGVSDVVVTEQLRQWHALHTLELAYRDAYHNQLNDRYRAQFSEYRAQAKLARDRAYQFGLGVVLSPLPAAPLPEFSFAAGPLPGAIYFARVSWVAASGQEGEGSAITSYEAPPGGLPVISMSAPPPNAVGFNAYLGLTAGALTRQNTAPVVLGDTFTVAPTGLLVEGPRVANGQQPDVYLTNAPVLRRG